MTPKVLEGSQLDVARHQAGLHLGLAHAYPRGWDRWGNLRQGAFERGVTQSRFLVGGMEVDRKRRLKENAQAV